MFQLTPHNFHCPVVRKMTLSAELQLCDCVNPNHLSSGSILGHKNDDEKKGNTSVALSATVENVSSV